MSGHLVYHWKHGWIPLTHAAALSKAHGNSRAADKYVPGASQHGDAHTRGKSARQIHASLGAHVDVSHPVGSHVVARQPGIETATRGVVMGHKGGMVQVAHKDRHGATVVGTFNPHHVTPAEPPTRSASTAAEVAGLSHGDKARVSGMDEHGSPMTFTGTVSGKPTNVLIKEHRNGKPVPHIAVQMHNGSDASGMDATARSTVYVPNPKEAPSVAKEAPSTKGPESPREAFRMGGPELRQHAANGSAVAQAEIDRRAAKRGSVPAKAPSKPKAAAPATKPHTAAPATPVKPAQRTTPPVPPKAPEAPAHASVDPKEAAVARWEAENARIAPEGHTIESRVTQFAKPDGSPRGIHIQHAANGERVGSVYENNGGDFAARLNGKSIGAFPTRAAAHQALADKHQAKADSLAKKKADVQRRQAKATSVGHFQPHVMESDGTTRGDAAAAKIKQSFKLNDHVVHIETAMNKEQTKAFLDDVHSVLLKSGHLDSEGITFHVPSGDKKFRQGRRGTTGGYVRRGQRAIFINPKIASGAIGDSFGGPNASESFMPAAKQTTGRQYVITHELGHVLDNEHQHTHETQYLGSHRVAYDHNRDDVSALQREHRTNLSRYGQTNVAESYAEAYAQWIHAGPGSSPAADAYAAKFGWVVPKWYREGRPRA